MRRFLIKDDSDKKYSAEIRLGNKAGNEPAF